jgi:hypothetical protein
MNGVRRFLGNATSPPTSTPANKDRASTSSRSSSPTKELPPPPPTKALFIRKERKPPPPVSGSSSTTSSPTASTPPPRRKAPPSEWEEALSPSPSHSQANNVQLANTRDVLLLSLLSSEAMVESRDYEVLSAEEVEEFKKASTIIDVEFHELLGGHSAEKQRLGHP